MRAFNIVSQDNKIRKILKQNTIFLIKLPNEKTIKILNEKIEKFK